MKKLLKLKIKKINLYINLKIKHYYLLIIIKDEI